MPPEANAPVLAGFLDYLRIEKGLARLSIAAYSTDIGQFAGFLENRKRILLTARRNDVREFLQQLFSHQVDGRSVGRKLSALRHLYRYLLLDKTIEHDPTLNIETPRHWRTRAHQRPQGNRLHPYLSPRETLLYSSSRAADAN